MKEWSRHATSSPFSNITAHVILHQFAYFDFLFSFVQCLTLWCLYSRRIVSSLNNYFFSIMYYIYSVQFRGKIFDFHFLTFEITAPLCELLYWIHNYFIVNSSILDVIENKEWNRFMFFFLSKARIMNLWIYLMHFYAIKSSKWTMLITITFTLQVVNHSFNK